MVKAGIIGGAGYTAGELLRILLHHPEVSVDFVYSESMAGKKIAEIHHDLLGQTDLFFTDQVNPEVEVLFLCSGHGKSRSFLEQWTISEDCRVIDLGNDFRMEKDAVHEHKNFVYGLPEYQKDKIAGARYIANPGCFATAIQLALLPLAAAGLLEDAIHVNGTTGSTGAGAMPSSSTHFSWRDNNLSWYKPFTHQHLGEINQTLQMLQPELPEVYFLPHRGNFSRGIFVTAYTALRKSLDEIWQLYEKFYSQHPFVHISREEISLKQVLNTNNAVLHLHQFKDQLLITSAIDNLVKGASGQAVQNMNLMFGWDQRTGLLLKGSNF